MVKQKLFGVALIAVSIVAIPFLDGDASHTVFLVPAGLYFIFARHNALEDD